jgi:hypothetical protein
VSRSGARRVDRLPCRAYDEIVTPLGIDEIARRLKPFLEGKGVLKAIVFGSWAPALVVNTERRFLDRYEHVRSIEDVLPGIHVEMLIYAPGELEAIAHRPFIRDLLNQGKVIHER